MEEIYDLAILGAGPAGICAAIYATRGKLNTLWLEKKFVQGGQIVDTYEVDNYPGLPGITGLDLGETMVNHAEKLGIKPKREPVLSIEEENGLKVIRTKKNRYMAKAVILACGAAHRQLGIPGEEELSGMGVSYCATCDGAFFRNKTVAVVGGGDVALEDALYLAAGCEKVYLIHRRQELRGTKVLQEQVANEPKITFLPDTVVKEICGEQMVDHLVIANTGTGEEKELPVSGIFIAVGMNPQTDAVVSVLDLDHGYVRAGEDGVTEQPGLFVAGDVRTKKLRQIVTAVADGANSVTSIVEYLKTL